MENNFALIFNLFLKNRTQFSQKLSCTLLFGILMSKLILSTGSSTLSSFSLNKNIELNDLVKQNPLIDDLTSMLNHVEYTKSCGDNLQKFNLDLAPLWSKKFKTQIQKLIHLTNLLNDLLESSEFNSSLIDSKYLSALSHFMFKTYNYNNEKTDDQTDDHFFLGFGLVLIEPAEKCFFIRLNANKTKKDKYIIEKSCSKINFKLENSITEYSLNKHYILNYEENEDSLIDCFNWFQKLQDTYIDIKKDISLNLNYQLYLEKIIENKNLSSKFFCGPVFECLKSESTQLNKQNGFNTNTNLNYTFYDQNWVLLFTLPLFDGSKNFKGSTIIKLKLTNIDINQCPNGDPIFSGTHKCKKNSECIFTPMKLFKAGNYKCRCENGFISSSNTNGTSFNPFDGATLEQHYWLMKNHKNNSYLTIFNCLPCHGVDCCKLEANLIDSNFLYINNYNNNNLFVNKEDFYFNSNKEYYIIQTNLFWSCRKYNMFLRYTIFIIQILFVLITITLSVIVFYSRHNKIIKHSMWVLLEIILLGAMLLYSTLLIQHFEPTTNICIIIPWFRELGFTIVYGIINLRLYKILVEFQSRKAHCVQLKDKDILRILFFMIICVFGYLTAWTLVDLDYANEGFSLVANTSLKGFVQYPICKIKWWDYFIEIAEFLFICVGFYLLYCTRTAPCEYNERKFLSLVIYCEGIISTLLHVTKHSIFSSIHPDTILILYFIRCHTTVTIMLLIVFFTKLYIIFKPNSDEYSRNSRLSTTEINEPVINSDSIKFQVGLGFINNEFENGDLNLTGMEPEEIKSELKRLYTQLHVYKTKSIKKDNPHLQSKRKGINKKHRRFSTQFSKSNNKENESFQIKTPDESIDENNIPHSFIYEENNNLMKKT